MGGKREESCKKAIRRRKRKESVDNNQGKSGRNTPHKYTTTLPATSSFRHDLPRTRGLAVIFPTSSTSERIPESPPQTLRFYRS